MTWYNPFSWFDVEKAEEIELTKVTWEEDVERTYHLVTVELGWGGGPVKEVTYCAENSWPYQDLNDIDGYPLDIQFNGHPAYSEELEREEVTKEETDTKHAWVEGKIPPGVEDTGVTKTVLLE